MTHRIRLDRRQVLAGALAIAAVPGLACAQAPLKIATIGSGHIGGTLGALWIKAGHPVMFSSRHPETLKDMVAGLGPLASAGTPAEAVAFADVVLIAVPYGAEKAIGQELGKALAQKQLVLDASNPIVPRDGDLGAWAREQGAGKATLELMPGIRLVRGFNAVGYMTLRDHPGREIGMPLAGDDKGALAIAEQLAREAGVVPVVIGGIDMAKYCLPGTPVGGIFSPDELRQRAAGLK